MDLTRFTLNKDEAPAGKYCFVPDAIDNNRLRRVNNRFIVAQVQVVHDSTLTINLNYKNQFGFPLNSAFKQVSRRDTCVRPALQGTFCPASEILP